jgi:catechol 2,3-dioxygenase-like lactoylglutathione lyase family enzyme
VLDHAAFPCFDLAATHRFYTEVLGFTLLHASTGSAAAWGKPEYFLVIFGLPGGGGIDFFHVKGWQRPPADDLPRDVRHVAVLVPTREAVRDYEARLRRASADHWTETHNVDDVHVYAVDPNGFVLEILAEKDGFASLEPDEARAARTFAEWRAKGRFD